MQHVRLLESENYYISVDGVFLTLEKNMRSKDSSITYTFGENIISARIDLKEVSQKQPVTGGLGLDDKTGKPYPNETESSPATEKEKTDGKFSVNTIAKTAINQGKKIFDFDINSKKIGEHVENFLGSNPTESKNKASHINREQAEKVLTCDISIELDVHRKAGEVVTLNLPIGKLSGNWLVEKSVHIIDKNGGYTELSLSKTGTNRPIKASKEVNDAKVNSTEGGAKSGAKRRLFNVNGKEIIKR